MEQSNGPITTDKAVLFIKEISPNNPISEKDDRGFGGFSLS
jgi:hypothetical protein